MYKMKRTCHLIRPHIACSSRCVTHIDSENSDINMKTWWLPLLAHVDNYHVCESIPLYMQNKVRVYFRATTLSFISRSQSVLNHVYHHVLKS